MKKIVLSLLLSVSFLSVATLSNTQEASADQSVSSINPSETKRVDEWFKTDLAHEWIQVHFGKTPSDLMTWEELEKLTYLSLTPGWDFLGNYSGTEVTNALKDFQILPNVTHLNIRGLPIQTLTPLQTGYEKLETLEIVSIDLSGKTLSPLTSLINLKKLDLSYTNLSTISSLSKLSNLETIYLDHNPALINCSPLNQLTKVKYLSLVETGFGDSGDLNNIIKMKDSLTFLNIGGTISNNDFFQLKNWKKVAEFKNLNALVLSYSKLFGGEGDPDNIDFLYENMPENTHIRLGSL